MPKRYIILFTLLVGLIATIFATQKKEPNFTIIKPQLGKITNSSEWINTESAISEMELQLKRNPRNSREIKINLAMAYMQEGRITGENGYYDALAFKMINDVLAVDPENFEALSCKATLQASAHQFSSALKTANTAIKINPYNANIYGVKCDALVELGRYDDAIETCDKMVRVRPDLRSYSRVSYLREIVGDYPGAIDAMNLALSSGYPGMEQTEWVRVYLGRLYEITGNTQAAEMHYRQACLNRNYYAPALVGLARIEKSKKNYSKAISYYKQATEFMKDYSFHQELAVLYELMDDKEKSKDEYQQALNLLLYHKHPTSEENGVGHHVDGELALVYLSMNQNEKALNSAIIEYKRRPENIDVNEVLAWAYYKTKDNNRALSHLLKALKTKSNNAELWYKAGLIFKANNLNDLGNKYCAAAVRTYPLLDTAAIAGLQINKIASR